MNSMIVVVFAALAVAAANAGVLGGVPIATPWAASAVASPWATGVVASPWASGVVASPWASGVVARSVVASPLAAGIVAPGVAATRSVVAGPSGTIVQDSPAGVVAW